MLLLVEFCLEQFRPDLGEISTCSDSKFSTTGRIDIRCMKAITLLQNLFKLPRGSVVIKIEPCDGWHVF